MFPTVLYFCTPTTLPSGSAFLSSLSQVKSPPPLSPFPHFLWVWAFFILGEWAPLPRCGGGLGSRQSHWVTQRYPLKCWTASGAGLHPSGQEVRLEPDKPFFPGLGWQPGWHEISLPAPSTRVSVHTAFHTSETTVWSLASVWIQLSYVIYKSFEYWSKLLGDWYMR